MRGKHKNIQIQLRQIERELQGSVSKERLTVLKAKTITIAKLMDGLVEGNIVEGAVNEMYQNESKYPKRRVKKVVRVLIENLISFQE